MTAKPWDPNEAAPCVMLIDDDEDVRALVRRLLQLYQYRVAEAESGHRALALLDEGLVPSVILLDLHMPGIDGRACFEAMRARDAVARVPVVVVSADNDPRAFMNGCDVAAFMQKPIRPTKLMSMLEEVLGMVWPPRGEE